MKLFWIYSKLVKLIVHLLLDLIQRLLKVKDSDKCLELFARYLVPGWTSLGKEVLRFQDLILLKEFNEAADWIIFIRKKNFQCDANCWVKKINQSLTSTKPRDCLKEEVGWFVIIIVIIL